MANRRKRLTGKKRTAFRIFAVVLGLVLAALLIEGTLRLIGLFVFPKAYQPITDKDPSLPVFSILCVGDSHIEGKGSTNRRLYAFPSQLAILLNHADPSHFYQVLNAGVPGHNSSQTLSMLEQQLATGPPPDLVLWLSGKNNDHNLTDAYFLPDEVKGLGQRGKVSYLLENSRALRLGRITVRRLEKLLTRSDLPEELNAEEMIHREQDRQFLSAWIAEDLIRAKALTDKVGAKLVPVTYYLPVPYLIDAYKQARNQTGMEFIDCRNFGLLFPAPKSRLVAGDGHPNDEGYVLIGRHVFVKLAEKGLVPISRQQADAFLAASPDTK